MVLELGNNWALRLQYLEVPDHPWNQRVTKWMKLNYSRLEAPLHPMGIYKLCHPRRLRKWGELDEVEQVASSSGDGQGGTRGRMSSLWIEWTDFKWGGQKRGSNVRTNSWLPWENHSAPGPIGSSLPNHFLSLEITIADKNVIWSHAGHAKFKHFGVLIEDTVVNFVPLHISKLKCC